MLSIILVALAASARLAVLHAPDETVTRTRTSIRPASAPPDFIAATGTAVAITAGVIGFWAVCCCAGFCWWLRRGRRARAAEEIPLSALDDEEAIPPVLGLRHEVKVY